LVLTTIENIFKVMTIEGLEDWQVLVLLVGEGDDEDDIGVLVQVVGQCGGQERESNAGAELLGHSNLIDVRIQLKPFGQFYYLIFPSIRSNQN